jgi:hypothetical protein
MRLADVAAEDVEQETTEMLARRKELLGTIGLMLAAILFLAGCSGQPLSTREEGTGIGAVLGAGTGAIIGAAVHNPAAGAAIGGALGAGGGFLVGNQMQNTESQQTQTQAQIQQQQQQIEQQRQQLEQLKQEQETE